MNNRGWLSSIECRYSLWLGYVQTRIIRYARIIRRTRVAPRPHPREGCLRSRASKRSLISLAPSIDNSQTNREWHETGLFAPSSSPRDLSSPSFRHGSPFPPPRFSSLSSRLDSVRRPHKDIPRERTLTITASHAFIARLGGAHTIAILLVAIKYWCKNRYPKPRAVFSMVRGIASRESRTVSSYYVCQSATRLHSNDPTVRKTIRTSHFRVRIYLVTRIYRRRKKRSRVEALVNRDS